MPLLDYLDISTSRIFHNASPAVLYGRALANEKGSVISSTGALIALSGEKTGRSPSDKRIVDEPESSEDIWWGAVNITMSHHSFESNRERAIDYLNTKAELYVVDGYAGWDPAHQIKVRVICARAYHALFMSNMLIRPTKDQLEVFGDPDYHIINSGGFPANRFTEGMTSRTSVDLSLSERTLVILGTEYAGEMKKGVFTIMNYLMPKQGHLSMHCSATEGEDGTTSILFGLSGTGKTTLSADPERKLIGDDEHVWTDQGIFNIEGGCYAKAIDLSEQQEPDIFRAIRFGTVLENVVYDSERHEVDYSNCSITKNTRASYPIEFIDKIKLPCIGQHPQNVIFLTCDAFGVLPPVSKLSPEQAMYHFMSGYTAKVAGTEMGVTDPEATFSPCYGGPFMVWHPAKYAKLLAEKLKKHSAQTWLVNTGWSGGGFGAGGQRISLQHTRAIVRAIHSGSYQQIETARDSVFGLEIPKSCPGVPAKMLNPRETWKDQTAYDRAAAKLAKAFRENFQKYESQVGSELKQGGPLSSKP